MNSPQKIRNTVIVPAYNEEAGLDVVLGKLSKIIDQSTEIIVVDDGSTDLTAEIALRLGAKVVRHYEFGRRCRHQDRIRIGIF